VAQQQLAQEQEAQVQAALQQAALQQLARQQQLELQHMAQVSEAQQKAAHHPGFPQEESISPQAIGNTEDLITEGDFIGKGQDTRDGNEHEGEGVEELPPAKKLAALQEKLVGNGIELSEDLEVREVLVGIPVHSNPSREDSTPESKKDGGVKELPLATTHSPPHRGGTRSRTPGGTDHRRSGTRTQSMAGKRARSVKNYASRGEAEIKSRANEKGETLPLIPLYMGTQGVQPIKESLLLEEGCYGKANEHEEFWKLQETKVTHGPTSEELKQGLEGNDAILAKALGKFLDADAAYLLVEDNRPRALLPNWTQAFILSCYRSRCYTKRIERLAELEDYLKHLSERSGTEYSTQELPFMTTMLPPEFNPGFSEKLCAYIRSHYPNLMEFAEFQRIYRGRQHPGNMSGKGQPDIVPTIPRGPDSQMIEAREKDETNIQLTDQNVSKPETPTPERTPTHTPSHSNASPEPRPEASPQVRGKAPEDVSPREANE
jgi:hypothetical protein